MILVPKKKATGVGAAVVAAALLAACSSDQVTVSSDTTTAGAAATTTTTAGPATASTTASTPTTAAGSAGAAQATTTTAAATASANTDATPAIVAAADAFLATLSASEKTAVQFAWTETAQRQRWSNLPQGLFQRSGLMWGDLSEAQQNAWLGVMKATLSTEGYNRVLAEWNADDALAAEGSGGNLQFGKQYYWIAIIGTPSKSDPWQWQWGGHHVTVNATVVGSKVALTPSFIGDQPATYTDANGTTVRPLGDIIDEAFALVNSLDATQQAAAVLGGSPIDLVLGPGQDGKTIQAEGLAASKLTAGQQAALLSIIGHYSGLANAEDAAARLAEITATLSDTYFVWYGPTASGSAAYFRIAGPRVVIEYAPQSMGGNAANHIHGIYRDPANDYGVAYSG